MEPATDQRKYLATNLPCEKNNVGPQWSTPLTGGNTCHGEVLLGHSDIAAMESPFGGQEPPGRSPCPRLSERCRNGARR
jgi:hypothetical protein